MDHYIREDVRIACSKGWRKLVDSELNQAAALEQSAMAAKYPELRVVVEYHFRRALAVERMHQMVQKGLIPEYDYIYERWMNPD